MFLEGCGQSLKDVETLEVGNNRNGEKSCLFKFPCELAIVPDAPVNKRAGEETTAALGGKYVRLCRISVSLGVSQWEKKRLFNFASKAPAPGVMEHLASKFTEFTAL